VADYTMFLFRGNPQGWQWGIRLLGVYINQDWVSDSLDIATGDSENRAFNHHFWAIQDAMYVVVVVFFFFFCWRLCHCDSTGPCWYGYSL
jgi:hypothetical protein